MDDYGRKALLFDVYGPLLTERQQEIYDLVYGEDMSLGEIAESLTVSRQAVHDSLKRTGCILEEYERKLGLAEKFMAISAHVAKIRKEVTLLTEEGIYTKEMERILLEINAIDAWERR